jgi:hypothetical protein
MDDTKASAFIAAINAASAASGLPPDEVVAVLAGCACEAAAQAWGAGRAAHEVYLLSLQLAQRAGLDEVSRMAKSALTH